MQFQIGVVTAWMVYGALPLASWAQQPSAISSAAEDSLKRFLQNYARRPRLEDDEAIRYFAAFVDLNGDGKNEVIIHLAGRSWCGSGGCPTLVLASEASSYRVITKITITQPPIRVLTGASHGWRNISVWVQGGGIQPGYEAELRFNGKNYPSNPSVPPARRLATQADGRVVVPSPPAWIPLFP